MVLIDISWPIKPGMTQYKDKGQLTFVPLKKAADDGANETRLEFSVHTGTHVDAPSHFLADTTGKTTEFMPLSQLIGICAVFDMTHVTDKITAADLELLPLGEHLIVLFKTQNSFTNDTDPYDPQFVYIDPSAAQLLADKKVKAVGLDYLGVERDNPAHTTHDILFGANIAIIEGLRLAHVNPGPYTLLCFPLSIHGIEAAPARAVLVTE